jgi:ornithine cyclodeaminase/alanine dehydrogenase-like protein (mu-crystallin family)
MFDSTGLAIQDLAIAIAAFEEIGEIPGLAQLEL